MYGDSMKDSDPGFHPWITNAIATRSTSGSDTDWDLSGLSTQDVESFANDLDDIYSEVSTIAGLFGELRSNPPSTEALEDVLIELEVKLAHAAHHWRRSRLMLRSYGLWIDEDIMGDER